MKCLIYLSGLLMLMASLAGVAAPLSLPEDPPFHVYSVADGLNQKAAQAVVQDSKGLLWIGSYGGLNQFNGSTFKSLTTRHGLRQNFVTALVVDDSDRLWAGDAEGGVTLIENGAVTLTIEPPEDSPGTIRAMAALNGFIYMGTEPGSLRRLSITRPELGIEYITKMSDGVVRMAATSDGELLLLGFESFYRFDPGEHSAPLLLDAELTGLTGGRVAGVYVGNEAGQVGRWNNGEIVWLPELYGQPVMDISFRNGSPQWVHTADYLIPFGKPDQKTEIFDASKPLVDKEGVLWIPQASGLARHLGEDFNHYSLTTPKGSPSVFSIQPDVENGYWFGTDQGLLRVDKNGVITEMAEATEMPISEVRSLKLASDQKTLWVPHIGGRVFRVDTQTFRAQAVFPDRDNVTVGMELDHSDRVWAGSYDGTLFRHDPRKDETTEIDMGAGASVYSLDMGADGWLWFTVNYSGIYRINTLIEDSQPERVISSREIGKSLFTHLVVQTTDSGPTELWFTTTDGGVYQWQDGNLITLIDDPFLSDQTIYSIQPLKDKTIVISSNKGAYRFDLNSKELQHYGPLNGFKGVEGKAHAMLLENDDTLWIGTGSGISVMDVSRPMLPVPNPETYITKLSIDEKQLQPSENAVTEIERGNIVVEFSAISTRAPAGVEYSYMLSGFAEKWSAPTVNASVGYSHLPPGNYEFRVRARRAGGSWGKADRWAFVILTPFWRTPWFIALAMLLVLVSIRGAVHLRLRAIAKANMRLREEVAERTRSIESGRTELLNINDQLSREIEERKRSDALRADVEARFHQAYQNSPIGMALVDKEGAVYDANPVLKKLFWPKSRAADHEPLIDVIAASDRNKFELFLETFWSDSLDSPSMEFDCISCTGDTRRIDFLPSAVRDDSGDLQYIVLLANDVTESHAMTDQLKYQASYDELTGLLNRRAYGKRLESAGRTSKNDSFLLLLDLDQFKVVNDTCGHAAGDELLRIAANAIAEGIRNTDTAARLGGDEFAVILTGCNEALAIRRADAIRKAIQDIEFFWDSERFRIGVSIGVVPISKSTKDLSELQQLADAACYAAKEAGRNRVHLISSEQDAAYEHRGEMRWVQRLKQAIDTDGFVLFGQRIQPLGSETNQERIEVLIRMRDRQANRLIPPGAFLPTAERYGLNDKLDLWVVSQVLQFIGAQKPEERAARQFWVNLSGASISDRKFSIALIYLVANSGIPEGSINFEITETAAIRKVEDAARLVASLQDLGCKFALDDFGSGLSAFGHLKKLEIDYLKVDGEFIRNITTDPTDHIFVKSIIDIAHAMDIGVVTEFVEDEHILKRVKELGADYAQGFGVHRPEPLDQLVDLAIPGATAKG